MLLFVLCTFHCSLDQSSLSPSNSPLHLDPTPQGLIFLCTSCGVVWYRDIYHDSCQQWRVSGHLKATCPSLAAPHWNTSQSFVERSSSFPCRLPSHVPSSSLPCLTRASTWLCRPDTLLVVEEGRGARFEGKRGILKDKKGSWQQRKTLKKE